MSAWKVIIKVLLRRVKDDLNVFLCVEKWTFCSPTLITLKAPSWHGIRLWQTAAISALKIRPHVFDKRECGGGGPVMLDTFYGMVWFGMVSYRLVQAEDPRMVNWWSNYGLGKHGRWWNGHQLEYRWWTTHTHRFFLPQHSFSSHYKVYSIKFSMSLACHGTRRNYYCNKPLAVVTKILSYDLINNHIVLFNLQ